jgi:hypothetical protein
MREGFRPSSARGMDNVFKAVFTKDSQVSRAALTRWTFDKKLELGLSNLSASPKSDNLPVDFYSYKPKIKVQ